ncbi:MAG: hypothetical protein IJB47_01060 [Oscillospiraceae bacterium]|nr:hypothetical protein [Oscillospiraceae bacterium]
MLKRILAGLLSLVLILSVLPLSATAASQEEEKQIESTITKHYYRTVIDSGMENLKGYCGLLASWQLYLMGVNKSVLMLDGNMQYDYYCTLKETSGGYSVTTYSSKDYTLEDALNAITKNGSKNVYNILVGFQWTATEAGAKYGHALVVYAILDGMVYFTEGYDTSLGTAAGQPIKLSIAEFVDFYEDWTRFEGAVVFSPKNYLDTCTEYACHMIAEVSQRTAVFSLPATDEEETESSLLWEAVAGERVRVTGLYHNQYNNYYYRVDDCGKIGYISADSLIPELFVWDDVCLNDLQLPVSVPRGKSLNIAGEICSSYTKITGISLQIRSQDQMLVRSYSDAKASGYYQMESDAMEAAMALDTLSAGCYDLRVAANCWNYYLTDGRVQKNEEEITLLNKIFFVGKPSIYPVQKKTTDENNDVPDGWFYRQDKLYYYKDGKPVTGWICYHGIDYYLQEDGSVTTGWATINGSQRYFSGTGAMRTGWVTTEKGICYLLKNGVMAKGSYIVQGQHYKFSDTGWLLKSDS